MTAFRSHSLVTPCCRVVDPILQRTLRMRKALCATPESHSLANVVSPLLAPLALLARLADLKRYFVTNIEVLDLGADTNNNTGRLVAEREWLLHDDVAVAVVSVVVQV